MSNEMTLEEARAYCDKYMFSILTTVGEEHAKAIAALLKATEPKPEEIEEATKS